MASHGNNHSHIRRQRQWSRTHHVMIFATLLYGLLVLLGQLALRLAFAVSIVEYPIPSNPGRPYGITTGPDGNLWFAAQNGFTGFSYIGRITTAGVITQFPTPTAGSFPTGIVAGPDGNLWFTEYPINKIGRITTQGVITEFPVPTAGSIPVEITAEPDGNLWFTENGSDKIGRITPQGVITEIQIPSHHFGETGNPRPFQITTGPDRMVISGSARTRVTRSDASSCKRTQTSTETSRPMSRSGIPATATGTPAIALRATSALS